MDSATTTLHERRRLALRDVCLESVEDVAEYNLGLHVAALFVLLIVSGMAAVFPLLTTRYTFLRIPPTFFFVVRHFGTGVLIATAFCHLLPTAFSNLNDPCMGEFWTETYAAMPGAISLGSVFIVMTIEMLVSPFRRNSTLKLMPTVDAARALQDSEGCCNPASCGKIQETDVSINEKDPRPKRIQVVLLEAGIIFHSIFVGLTLGVTTGSGFVSLCVAIIFHQSFEGLALGSRIALAGWSPRTWRPWIMALAYGCTTPAGQAIGIGTHKLYSPDSQVGHTVVGFFNAVSSGFLLYAALVELLSEDFLSQRSWYEMRGGRRVVAFALVFVGAFLMALIAHWV
ncbi:hypothetical protein CDV31_016443 [Fusarium ambrosium]|uniref:Zinc-regulated transporter 2 n=1 Tax=Fusarium ambrosium TaxID=131363 RepID=A0A428S933_9HYPO|nr:hypothetical protein CDV31_016443 [Fusarium ambrosium]